MEDKFLKLVKELCGTQPIIADIGAREGAQSRKFKEEFPDAKIHAFEPNPYWMGNLQSNRFSYHEVALTDQVGDTDFYAIKSNNRGASSLFVPPEEILVHDGKTEYEKITVRGDTLSNYGLFDAIWMDVQGAELKVLTGADLTRTKVIATECETKQVYPGAVQFPELSKFMHDNDFVLVYFEQDWEKEANLIYVRRSNLD